MSDVTETSEEISSSDLTTNATTQRPSSESQTSMSSDFTTRPFTISETHGAFQSTSLAMTISSMTTLITTGDLFNPSLFIHFTRLAGLALWCGFSEAPAHNCATA